MPVKILIVDPVATNRIVLKVKLLAAFYEVLQAPNAADAKSLIAASAPDLVLLGSGLSVGEASELAADISHLDGERAGNDTHTPIMALLPAASTADRRHLLEAGIDDVMERPLDDLILLARLRCLMRANQAERELRLRDGTRRALGLADAAHEFETPPRISLAGDDLAGAQRLGNALKKAMPGSAIQSDLRASLLAGDEGAPPDVFVVMISNGRTDEGLSLISNIRARPAQRNATILAIAPRGARQVVASALDQGANDLVPNDVEVNELALRLKRLTARKRTAERLRQTVQSGLHAALTDPLTGLYNRRYAMPHLQRMAEHCRLSGRSFAVMIADLDHFKKVNDTFGHPVGDLVLVEAAQRLTNNLRPVDLVSRIGGEEFLIAMPDTDSTAARAAARRLCGIIADTPFRASASGPEISVTASIGVVLGTGASADLPSGLEALMMAADRALYGSKTHGRNQFTLARNAAA